MRQIKSIACNSRQLGSVVSVACSALLNNLFGKLLTVFRINERYSSRTICTGILNISKSYLGRILGICTVHAARCTLVCILHEQSGIGLDRILAADCTRYDLCFYSLAGIMIDVLDTNRTFCRFESKSVEALFIHKHKSGARLYNSLSIGYNRKTAQTCAVTVDYSHPFCGKISAGNCYLFILTGSIKDESRIFPLCIRCELILNGICNNTLIGIDKVHRFCRLTCRIGKRCKILSYLDKPRIILHKIAVFSSSFPIEPVYL